MNKWTIEKARHTYNVSRWSDGYFDINEQGHLIARPRGQHSITETITETNTEIDLYKLTEEIKQAGLNYPVLVRFTDILQDRVNRLGDAFRQAMKNNSYQGSFTCVYPVKVNQQRSVVDKIYNVADEQVGLEAGSKPELMAVLALSSKTNSVIVCNGYKDREYIRLALRGQQLGNKIYIVIEKESELDLIIEQANELNVRPLIGIRIRLASTGTGLWQNTGGEKSKFGLSATQALAVIERLEKIKLLDALELLHFHMGSQLPNIRDIKNGLSECARYYAEFHRLGVHIRCIDVGGGLGINYDGTHSRNFCSMNYDINQYASCIVNTLSQTCSDNDLPHPDIITESGRALTAHHAVLITNVVATEIIEDKKTNTNKPNTTDLNDSSSSPIEQYHDVTHQLSDMHADYTQGKITLQQRAAAEQNYFSQCWKIRTSLQASTKAHRDTLDELNEKLSDKYFCNFSIFQSIPDVWAISQIFPIVPLHRLHETPDRRARLHDITCDSDGRIDHYVDAEGIESSLPLHALNENEPYLLGIFLTGAYQEILGDIHNLFGETDSINVTLNNNGGYKLSQATRGDTVESVLKQVKYSAAELILAYKEKIKMAGLEKPLSKQILQELECGTVAYTYLKD